MKQILILGKNSWSKYKQHFFSLLNIKINFVIQTYFTQWEYGM